jgi:hypothetical protein
LEVGLESGKTMGRGCDGVTISSTALGEMAPLKPDWVCPILKTSGQWQLKKKTISALLA